MSGEKIRIAFLIDRLRIGGTENQLRDLVNRLDRSLFEPVLVCNRESDAGFVEDLDCELQLFPFISFKSVSALKAMVRLVRFLRSRKIDIVQTYFISATVFGVVGAKLARVKKIIVCKRDLGYWQDRRSLRTLALVNRWVDRFWANSAAVAEHVEEVERVPREKIDVIYNGIDLEACERKRADDSGGRPADAWTSGPVVGIVANLNRMVKRVDLFIEAASRVGEQYPDARFWVIGDGRFRSRLEGEAREAGLGERLTFLGQRSDAVFLAGHFDVGVICSDSEGFSNSILEYFALGIPVVATAAGGNREIISDGEDGLLVPPGNGGPLADALLRLLGDESLRRDMGRRGREKVTSAFSWPARISEIEAYYRSLK